MICHKDITLPLSLKSLSWISNQDWTFCEHTEIMHVIFKLQIPGDFLLPNERRKNNEKKKGIWRWQRLELIKPGTFSFNVSRLFLWEMSTERACLATVDKRGFSLCGGEYRTGQVSKPSQQIPHEMPRACHRSLFTSRLWTHSLQVWPLSQRCCWHFKGPLPSLT